MNQFERILVCTDTRFESHPIVEASAELALQNGASIKLMDVIPDFSWIVKLTLTDHDEIQRTLINEKLEALEALAEPLRKQNLEVETMVGLGKTSIEIIREVLRNQHDLVMRVAKGKNSKINRHFGQTATRLLRKCPCALWLVPSETVPRYKNVLGCVDTCSTDTAEMELNDKIVQLTESLARNNEGIGHILHAWSIWNEPMFKSRMNAADYAELQEIQWNDERQMFDDFLEKHGMDANQENVHLLKGTTNEVISDFIFRNGIDLLVMGTIARSGLSGALIGNNAEQILGSIECSVLALKPSNFVTPVRLDSSAESSAFEPTSVHSK